MQACRKLFSIKKGIKTGDDEYTVMANITFHYLMVLDNCTVESTRKKMQAEHDNLAREKKYSAAETGFETAP